MCLPLHYLKRHVAWVSNLLTHAVDPIRPEQVDRLLHQVRAAAAEHTEAQVLQELCLSGGGIQFPRGAEAVIRSEGQSTQSDSQHKSTLWSVYDAPHLHWTPDKLWGGGGGSGFWEMHVILLILLIMSVLHVSTLVRLLVLCVCRWTHTLCGLKAWGGGGGGAAVPELPGFTVHSRQQQPGRLPDVIAVHREAASVLRVDHCRAHPLHQGWQHQKGPVGGDESTCSHHITNTRTHSEVKSHWGT